MKRKKDSYTQPFPRDANEDGRGKEEYVLWFDHNTRNWPFIIWGLGGSSALSFSCVQSPFVPFVPWHK